MTLIPDNGQPDRDRYGRMLRYVDHDAKDASAELLAAGAAHRYNSDPRLARSLAYAAATAAARADDRGLWGNC